MLNSLCTIWFWSCHISKKVAEKLISEPCSSSLFFFFFFLFKKIIIRKIHWQATYIGLELFFVLFFLNNVCSQSVPILVIQFIHIWYRLMISELEMLDLPLILKGRRNLGYVAYLILGQTAITVFCALTVGVWRLKVTFMGGLVSSFSYPWHEIKQTFLLKSLYLFTALIVLYIWIVIFLFSFF